MSKTTNKFISIKLKIVFAISVVLGTFYEIDVASNFAVFLSWFFFLISIIGFVFIFALSDDEIKKVFTDWKPLLPAWIEIGFDLYVLMIMIWYGWIATAAAYSVVVFLKVFLYRIKKKCSEGIVNAKQV